MGRCRSRVHRALSDTGREVRAHVCLYGAVKQCVWPVRTLDQQANQPATGLQQAPPSGAKQQQPSRVARVNCHDSTLQFWMHAYRYDALAVSKQSSSAARRWCTTSPLLHVADLGACGSVRVRQCRRKRGVHKGAAEGCEDVPSRRSSSWAARVHAPEDGQQLMANTRA